MAKNSRNRSNGQIMRDAVRWVNVRRRRAGMEPIDHLPHVPANYGSSSCPIARVLPGHAVVTSYGLVQWGTGTAVGEHREEHSDASLEFVLRFDNGQYPNMKISVWSV